MINFLEVEDTVKILKQQAESGTIDQETLTARLLELIDVGADGFYWMFGHKTGQWYRHNGQCWVPDNPGELTMATNKDNSPAYTEHRSAPAASTASQSVTTDWDDSDIYWFILGLVAIGAVFATVYASAL